MGVDHEFIIKVDDSRFVPSLDQLEQIVRLLDKYGLSANNYPSAEENDLFLAEMRDRGIIPDLSSLRDELKDEKVQDAIKKYFIGKGREIGVEIWINVRSYDEAYFRNQKLSRPIVGNPSNFLPGLDGWNPIPTNRQYEAIDFYLHLFPCERLYEKLKAKSIRAGNPIHVPPFGKGSLIVFAIEPSGNFFNTPGYSANSRFYIYSEDYMEHSGDAGLYQFRAFFEERCSTFLKEASSICGRKIVLDVQCTP